MFFLFLDPERSQSRLAVSFSVVLALHITAFVLLNRMETVKTQELHLISDVELLELEPEKTVPEPVAAPEPKKNFWEKISDSLPLPKRAPAATTARPAAPGNELFDLAKPKPEARQQALPEGEKLVDRSAPLERPAFPGKDDLARLRDQKLSELVDASGGDRAAARQLLQAEKASAGRGNTLPAVKLVDAAAPLEEVGTKRAAPQTALAIPVSRRRNASINDIQPLEGKQQRADRPWGSPEPGAGLKDRAPDGMRALSPGDANTVQRQRAREVLALQKLINESPEPRKAALRSSGPMDPAAPLQDNGAHIRDASAPIPKAPEEKVLPAQNTAAPVPDAASTAGRSRTRAIKNTIAQAPTAPAVISGPLEKRKILSSVVPAYPSWAKQKGIEADVSLKFFVNPAGAVLPEIFVVQTSGYGELDRLCKDNLKRWIFAPLPANEPQFEQWGILTIRFRLE